MAQAENRVRDLTQGEPAKLIFILALPMLAGNIVSQLYGFVDALVVGRFLGVEAMAAIGCVGSLIFGVNSFIGGTAYGFTIKTSQLFGAKDFDGVRRSALVSVLLALAVAAVVAVVGVVSCRAILTAMQTPPELFENASAFITVTFVTAVTLMMMRLQDDLVRALGNTEIPTKVWSLTLVLNAIFDVLAIVILDSGVIGVALATTAAQAIGCVTFFFYTKKKIPLLHSAFSREYLNFDRNFVLEHLKLGLPVGFQGAIIAIGGVILQVAINQLGASEVAAVTAGQRIEGLTLMFFLTFAQVISSFAAQNYGAERYERIIEGVKKCALITCGASFVITAVNVLAGAELLKIFIGESSPLVLEKGAFYLMVNGAFYWVLSLMLVFKLTLQGLGKNSAPTMAGTMELVVRIVVATFLVDELGFLGICLANPLSFIAACLPLIPAILEERRRFMGPPRDEMKTNSIPLVNL